MTIPERDNFGNKHWVNEKGQWHREAGPALEYANGSKSWYINGKCHRIDGPAIEYFDGYKEWFYNGKKIECSSQEEFERLMKLRIFW